MNAWAEAELTRQGLTVDDPGDVHAWSGWFCLASGCVEDKRDSYGECINCGEPVVRVWVVFDEDGFCAHGVIGGSGCSECPR